MTGKREKFSLSLLNNKQNFPRYQEITELCIDDQGISQLNKTKKKKKHNEMQSIAYISHRIPFRISSW